MEKLKAKMSQELSKIEERTGKIDDELQEVQARTPFINYVLYHFIYIHVFYLDSYSFIHLSFLGFLNCI